MQPDNLKYNYKKVRKTYRINVEHSTIAHLENKIRYIKQFSLKFTFTHSFLSLIKNIRGRLKGYKKAKNIFILDEFLSFWRKEILRKP